MHIAHLSYLSAISLPIVIVNTQIQIAASKQIFIFFKNYVKIETARFKWVHLSERLAYEAAVRQQRLRTEISQVDGDSVDDAIWSHNNVRGKIFHP